MYVAILNSLKWYLILAVAFLSRRLQINWMAPDTSSKILSLVKENKLSKARDLFDKEIAKISAQINDEKEREKKRSEFADNLAKELKGKKSSILYVLKGDSAAKYNLTYDAFGETMEPMYYWLLDFIRDHQNYEVEKTADFFSASEAGGYYGEMGMRRTNLEKRAVELLGTINVVIKSILNLLWDLKTFDLRLKHYDDLKSKNKDIKRSAVQALKGIWLNEVDKAKGNAAIDVLAQSLNFVTMRDAFMIVPVEDWYVEKADRKKIEDIKEKAVKYIGLKEEGMDLTEVVKRILAPRVKEFVEWLYISDRELRQRREVERSYFKAQYNALKVYTRWARPYLIATQKLIPAEYRELAKEHKELGLGPAAVPTPFHAMWFYIELQASKKTDIEELKKAPYYKEKIKLQDESLRPNQVIELALAFRGSPAMGTTGARGERGTGFTGRTFVKFTAYVMSSYHLELFKKYQDQEVLEFVDQMTTETLDALAEDIRKYAEEDREEKPEAKKTKFEIPFTGTIKELFGSLQKFNEEARKVYRQIAATTSMSSKDAWKIARLRVYGEEKVKKDLGKTYEVFKKAHKMLTPPG
jgi:hypothetical protein